MGKIKALMETLLGKAGGVASLDENGKLTEAQRPSVEEVPGLTEALNQKASREDTETFGMGVTHVRDVPASNFDTVTGQSSYKGLQGAATGTPPFMGEWVFVDTKHYDPDSLFGVQLAQDMNEQKMGFRNKRNGVWRAWNEILHTGNKPSGSYTGNGSSAYWEWNVGVGINGKALFVSSAQGSAIVTEHGAIAWAAGTMVTIPPGEVTWQPSRGVIGLATVSGYLNANGVEYNCYVI